MTLQVTSVLGAVMILAGCHARRTDHRRRTRDRAHRHRARRWAMNRSDWIPRLPALASQHTHEHIQVPPTLNATRLKNLLLLHFRSGRCRISFAPLILSDARSLFDGIWALRDSNPRPTACKSPSPASLIQRNAGSTGVCRISSGGFEANSERFRAPTYPRTYPVFGRAGLRARPARAPRKRPSGGHATQSPAECGA